MFFQSDFRMAAPAYLLNRSSYRSLRRKVTSVAGTVNCRCFSK